MRLLLIKGLLQIAPRSAVGYLEIGMCLLHAVASLYPEDALRICHSTGHDYQDEEAGLSAADVNDMAYHSSQRDPSRIVRLESCSISALREKIMIDGSHVDCVFHQQVSPERGHWHGARFIKDGVELYDQMAHSFLLKTQTNHYFDILMESENATAFRVTFIDTEAPALPDSEVYHFRGSGVRSAKHTVGLKRRPSAVLKRPSAK
eukprot:1036788-Karenia_brevis.AAC.1